MLGSGGMLNLFTGGAHAAAHHCTSSMNTMDADAPLGWEQSSPEPSSFGDSPSGRALQQARDDDREADFLAAFTADTPPAKTQPAAAQKLAFDKPLDPAADGARDPSASHERQPVSCIEEDLRSAAAFLARRGFGDSDDGELGSSDAGSDSAVTSSSDGSDDPPPLYAQGDPSSVGSPRDTMCGAVTDSARGKARSGVSASSSSLVSLSRAASVASSYKGVVKGGLKTQVDDHALVSSLAFALFRCKCEFKADDEESCLDSGFDRPFFRALHVQTYGRPHARHSLAQTKTAVHTAIWELRQSITADGQAATTAKIHCCVPEYRLGGPRGKIVCRRAFIAAVGGTSGAHRAALTSTIAGIAPGDIAAQSLAGKVVRELHAKTTPASQWA